MDKSRQLKRRLEWLWWAATVIVVVAVMLPIYFNFNSFPHWLPNVLFIVIFITYTRYTFLLKHTFIVPMQKLKVVLFLLNTFLTYVLINYIFDFKIDVDENGLASIMNPGVGIDNAPIVANYVKSEYVFFGTASVMATIVFSIRLIVSVWRFKNRGEA